MYGQNRLFRTVAPSTQRNANDERAYSALLASSPHYHTQPYEVSLDIQPKNINFKKKKKPPQEKEPNMPKGAPPETFI